MNSFTIRSQARRARRAALLAVLATGVGATSIAGVPHRATAGGSGAGIVQLASSGDTSSAVTGDYRLAALEATVGARAAWASGFTGQGVDVAVVDSGISPVAGLSAPGKVVYGPDFSVDAGTPELRDLDPYGHGTHMAGIIAGHDEGASTASPDDHSFLGVAPDARVLSVKAAGVNGQTTVPRVVAAIDWVTDHRNDNGMHVRVLNLSLGVRPGNRYEQDRLAGAVERAWQAGIVVVAAAGNDGKGSGQLNDPAYDPYVVAVGAADTNGTIDHGDDVIGDFSSAGSYSRAPDLVAPGVRVESLRVPGSVIDTAFPAPAGSDPRFVKGSGTSQAAAVVSGLAAIILQSRPFYSPDMVKSVLVARTNPLAASSATLQGFGEVDLGHSGPATAWIGEQRWRTSRYIGDDARATDGADSALRTADDGDPATTSGVRWNGVRWSGVRWSGVRWSGVRWG